MTRGNPIWNDDEIEIFLDTNRDQKTHWQIIVNATGEKMEFSEGGMTNIGARVAAHIEGGSRWMVELAIPFKGLGIKAPSPGDVWGFNLCRYRPGGADFSEELITWAPLQAQFKELENFGKLIFGK